MRRKNFFENIVNINKFGIVGTVLTFAFYSLMFICLFNRDIIELTYYNPEDYEFILHHHDDPPITLKVPKGDRPFELEPMQVIYICSILCSSDIIAAVTLVKFDE